MVKEKEALIRRLLQAVDVLALLTSFVLSYFIDNVIRYLGDFREMAYAISPDIEGLLFFSERNLWLAISIVPIWLGAMSAQGVYKDFRLRPFSQTLIALVRSVVIATLALGSVIFLLQLKLTSRLFIGVFTLTAFFGLSIEKWLVSRFLDHIHARGFNQINLLIVGSGRRAQEFIKTVRDHAHWGLRIVGLIDDEHGLYGKEINGCRVIGRLQDIPFILHHKVIDRVIFVVPRLWLNKIDTAIMACENEGVPTAVSVDLYNLKIAKVRQSNFDGFPLLEFETVGAKEWQLFLKRIIDIVFSLGLLVFTAPLFMLAAIAIRLTSTGPILYKQTRSGVNGRKFTLYKFRSMEVGAEMKRRQLEKMNEMSGPVFKMKRDPRITSVGRILRRLSIDELPQLFNVLNGDMSIVGPRPPLPVEVEMYEVWQRRRLSLKPGLTCTWQVSGRNEIGFERWMEMDLEYIDSWSLLLDLQLMVKTFWAVVTGRGAG